MAVDGPGDDEDDDQAGAENLGGKDAPPHPLHLPPTNPMVVALMRLAAVEMTPTTTGEETMMTRMTTLMTQVQTPISLTLNWRTPTMRGLASFTRH